MVNHLLHRAARRPKGLGWRYEAHLRGLGMGNINLTTTDKRNTDKVASTSLPFVLSKVEGQAKPAFERATT